MSPSNFVDPSPAYWQEYGPFQHAKHALVRRYLEGWLPKLGTWAGRVLYVDTHAGRGRHSSGESGSPLVALDTLLSHTYRDELLQKSEVRFFFIERDPANLEHLRTELRRRNACPPGVHVDTRVGNAYEILSDAVDRLRENGERIAPAYSQI